MLDNLKTQVLIANKRLVSENLVVLTWGNVSAFDAKTKLIVIKPSGVEYSNMTEEDLVVVDLDGNTVEGKLNPSSDTATHIEIYKAFPQIGGIVHTHSPEATAWAQACRAIPCYGTTHADLFYGDVPCTRYLTEEEVNESYEKSTGIVIVDTFKDVDPLTKPGILVAGHASFTWGRDANTAVDNAISLEVMARMARYTLQINPDSKTLPEFIKDKHYLRKHGKNAYYGQN
ncbi:MAG: L-ribulose-5-phosphate 4-epimerase [Coriobacteriia bacterium]|nr:L-ribulose-5-phosphate 4-epimerase [Coriobacteriia bacterium]